MTAQQCDVYLNINGKKIRVCVEEDKIEGFLIELKNIYEKFYRTVYKTSKSHVLRVTWTCKVHNNGGTFIEEVWDWDTARKPFPEEWTTEDAITAHALINVEQTVLKIAFELGTAVQAMQQHMLDNIPSISSMARKYDKN